MTFADFDLGAPALFSSTSGKIVLTDSEGNFSFASITVTDNSDSTFTLAPLSFLGTGTSRAWAGRYTVTFVPVAPPPVPSQNLVVAMETTDFVQTGVQATYTQLGTINPSITIAASSRVRVRITGRISDSDSSNLIVRLSIDSGASTVDLGRFGGDINGLPIEAEAIVTGLAAGAHAVMVEYTKGGAGILFLRGSSQPTLERFGIILEEIR